MKGIPSNYTANDLSTLLNRGHIVDLSKAYPIAYKTGKVRPYTILAAFELEKSLSAMSVHLNEDKKNNATSEIDRLLPSGTPFEFSQMAISILKVPVVLKDGVTTNAWSNATPVSSPFADIFTAKNEADLSKPWLCERFALQMLYNGSFDLMADENLVLKDFKTNRFMGDADAKGHKMVDLGSRFRLSNTTENKLTLTLGKGILDGFVGEVGFKLFVQFRFDGFGIFKS